MVLFNIFYGQKKPTINITKDYPLDLTDYLIAQCKIVCNEKQKKEIVNKYKDILHSDKCWFGKNTEVYVNDKLSIYKSFDKNTCTKDCYIIDKISKEIIDYDKTELEVMLENNKIMELINKWKIVNKISGFVKYIEYIKDNSLFNTDKIFEVSSIELKLVLKLLFPIFEFKNNIITINNKEYKLDKYDIIGIWINCVRICSGLKLINFKYSNQFKLLDDYYVNYCKIKKRLNKPFNLKLIKPQLLRFIRDYLVSSDNNYNKRLIYMFKKLYKCDTITKTEKICIDFINNENKRLTKKNRILLKDKFTSELKQFIETVKKNYNNNLISKSLLLTSNAKFMIAFFCKARYKKFIIKQKNKRLLKQQLAKRNVKVNAWSRSTYIRQSFTRTSSRQSFTRTSSRQSYTRNSTKQSYTRNSTRHPNGNKVIVQQSVNISMSSTTGKWR